MNLPYCTTRRDLRLGLRQHDSRVCVHNTPFPTFPGCKALLWAVWLNVFSRDSILSRPLCSYKMMQTPVPLRGGVCIPSSLKLGRLLQLVWGIEHSKSDSDFWHRSEVGKSPPCLHNSPSSVEGGHHAVRKPKLAHRVGLERSQNPMKWELSGQFPATPASAVDKNHRRHPEPKTTQNSPSWVSDPPKPGDNKMMQQ